VTRQAAAADASRCSGRAVPVGPAMGAVDVVAMSFPTFLAPAGPHQLDPDYHQDIRPVPEKEDTTGRALSLLRPQAPSPKRTLFNACIYLTHGSFTKGGWRLCRRGAIYDLLEV